MLLLYALHIPDFINSDMFQKFLYIVSEERQRRIQSFRNIEDKISILLAEILIRYILENIFLLPANKLSFQYNEYGKPSIKDMDGLFFNWSHSGNWIVCGIGDAEIGIDIEKHKVIGVDIAKHCFSKEENNAILVAHQQNRIKLFYEFWTLKESYIKAIGKALNISLKSFYFKLRGESIDLYIDNKLCKDYYFKKFEVDAFYSVSVCWQGDEFDLLKAQFEEINLQDLWTYEYKK